MRYWYALKMIWAEGLDISKLLYEVSKNVGKEFLGILSILEDSLEIPWDSWGFLGILGDSWGFLGIPGGTKFLRILRS